MLRFIEPALSRKAKKIRSNSIGVVRSKSVYWPKFANERIVNLGFLHRHKDSSHREDGAMLELLGALDFSRNLDGVSKRNEVVEGLSFEHDVRNVKPLLRLMFLTDRGGVTMYDPFLFFDQPPPSLSMYLETCFQYQIVISNRSLYRNTMPFGEGI